MSKRTKIQGIPATETIWVQATAADGTIYYTTAKTNNREFYFLYKMVDGKAVKLGKARNPKDLDDKYIL